MPSQFFAAFSVFIDVITLFILLFVDGELVLVSINRLIFVLHINRLLTALFHS